MDANRRIFVLESKTPDLLGEWIDRGKLTVPASEDEYAIDGTLYQPGDGRLYLLWSGREQSKAGAQGIYIAALENPWTLKAPRVRIAAPEHDWEKHGWAVNEGPEALEHDGRLFVVYSASGFSTQQYGLGVLEHRDDDLLNPKSWTKHPSPIFSSVFSGERPVIAPGHCSFLKSPDRAEDWIVYHARDGEDIRKYPRNVRAQRFRWSSDGLPSFGEPVRPGLSIPAPGGEP